ncbi:hypothetical protein PoB_005710500 [Plakobranchus ocellatus]|uniref:Uncharacterized protein n=1 Tax=Plakobranchus ocellatus TaxID=259542 RepID=A0AAV4CGF9_9GAST|nr:hypothetical protein PoB_005710500 [Plakobranchus ocellatus]
MVISSFQALDGGTQTRDRWLHADLRSDSLSIAAPTPREVTRKSQNYIATLNKIDHSTTKRRTTRQACTLGMFDFSHKDERQDDTIHHLLMIHNT